jgi:DNA-binding response OmpR family regulator
MTIRILFVDDEEDIREIAAMSLELDSEIEVTTCPSGSAAIAALRELPADLVMLDVMMPGMDGPSTLAALRAEHGDELPPVLFCTARTQSGDIQSYLDLGARGVIAKPFDPMSLAETVRGLM